MDLSSKSILVRDNGLFLSFAARMAQPGGFGTVYYANSWQRGRPSFHEITVGKGYEGIEVVHPQNPKAPDVYSLIDKVDVIAYPDCYDGEEQRYLREHGKKVWGSGMGVELELYRLFAKKVLAAVGLDVGPYVVVEGVTKLRKYLETHEDRVIKVSFVRGLMETRKHKKYWLSKTFIDWLQWRLGPIAEEQKFIVEEKIDTKLELGGDHVFAGRFPNIAINGLEIKDAAYVGIVQEYDEMPEEIRMVNDALEPVLKKMGVFNMFSHEDRIAEDGTVYPIDLTMRQGSPSGEAQLKTWENMPEMVYHGAHGEQVEPEPAASHVAQAMIFNNGDENDWCAVGVPKDLRNDVNLYFGMRKGSEDYVVPQQNPFDEVGSIVALGNTAEEAVKLCKKNAERLEGNIVVKCEALDEALEEIALMDKQGMNVESIPA